ncbi:hypothetical protein EDC05_002477 [Coemansia umbellata]|uniref:Zn(2)-C6 fungal-type domain-containing protein n=1 Tax=Coemansia umbellata TaxID=1424467 RepID=A0ABQ8PPF5_9FUNG|nr:hypothetical protein EDC05_002477 [Coemansia umbellata]
MELPRKVICKDGRVFHACEVCRKKRSRCDGQKPQCTSCQKRGLNCEYRAMRKRGRHGKQKAEPVDLNLLEFPRFLLPVIQPPMNPLSQPLLSPMAFAPAQTDQYMYSRPSQIFGSPSPTEAPFRSLSTSIFDSPGSLSMVAAMNAIQSPISLGSMLQTAPLFQPSPSRPDAMAAAVAALHHTGPASQPSTSMTSMTSMTSDSPKTGPDAWRPLLEEERVLDGLDADGADNFGRPVFDVSSYPLPQRDELTEHLNGIFEYFYMGVQTLHATFRTRVNEGTVSPILIYALMAVASRYSRKPSLHSLNGRAFLNGDRHASTACGLASIQLNHGELGIDAVHGMLFLSVYFMGQGNMLKSRMYLVKAVCTARALGFQNMDQGFVPSSPMVAFSGNHDRMAAAARACVCPQSLAEVVELETKRRIWWFLVFVDYFTANVMNMPVEIPPDSYCVRLPCSDEEWASPTLTALVPLSRDLGFGEHAEPPRGAHDCRPPWPYQPGAFYLERLMIEFCDHLRRLNNLRSLAVRSFFHSPPAFVSEASRKRLVPWAERLDRVRAAWSWLHMQLNKWLDSILLRFSEVINRLPAQYNRQYRHQYYYYLIAAHATIIMSHGVILQLFADFARYIGQEGPWVRTPPIDIGTNATLSEGLSEFAIGTGGSLAPLMQMAQGLSSGSSAGSVYGSVVGSTMGSPLEDSSRLAGDAAGIRGDLADMAAIAWDGCVSTAEQLASILRGKHPKFVLLGGPPIEVFREQVLAGDANILSQPGSAFNAPGTGPGADNPILSDPDFYMRLQPSTAWWMFLVAQVQVGHIKRLLKESEGSFKVSARRKALALRAAARATAAKMAAAKAASHIPDGIPDALRQHRQLEPLAHMRPLSLSVDRAILQCAPEHASGRASRLVRAYENLSCMVKVLEGMQQYWQCMDYISIIQDILKGSEHPLH